MNSPKEINLSLPIPPVRFRQYPEGFELPAITAFPQISTPLHPSQESRWVPIVSVNPREDRYPTAQAHRRSPAENAMSLVVTLSGTPSDYPAIKEFTRRLCVCGAFQRRVFPKYPVWAKHYIYLSISIYLENDGRFVELVRSLRRMRSERCPKALKLTFRSGSYAVFPESEREPKVCSTSSLKKQLHKSFRPSRLC
jgi:hypothetical protein